MSPESGGHPAAHSFDGRSAVVTGAAHGIGLATARLLSRSRAEVIAIDSDEDTLREAWVDGGAVAVVGDLGADDVADLAREIVQRHGPIELIVNNVGITTPHGFVALERDDFDRVLATNLRGPWFFTRELVRSLIAVGRRGAIVFVTSVHESHVRGYPHYSATKAAISMLAKELAHELGPFGIRANSVAPGWIRTEAHVDPEAARALAARIPVGRPGTPDDVAQMIAVLLDDELAGYVTGADVVVDGGLSLHTWLMDR